MKDKLLYGLFSLPEGWTMEDLSRLNLADAVALLAGNWLYVGKGAQWRMFSHFEDALALRAAGGRMKMRSFKKVEAIVKLW